MRWWTMVSWLALSLVGCQPASPLAVYDTGPRRDAPALDAPRVRRDAPWVDGRDSPYFPYDDPDAPEADAPDGPWVVYDDPDAPDGPWMLYDGALVRPYDARPDGYTEPEVEPDAGAGDWY